MIYVLARLFYFMHSSVYAVLVSCVFLSLLTIEYAQANGQKPGFKVYDALIYNNKPDTKEVGFADLTMLNHVHLWPVGDSRKSVPGDKYLKRYIDKQTVSDLVVLNVEHWPLKTDSDINENVIKYRKTIALVRRTIPGVSIGIYSMFPERNYWASQKDPSHVRYKSWASKNNRLSRLADEVDIIMPSLYTYYNDPEKWVAYAVEHVKESRRLFPDKPVYVFLWPQFHSSSWLYGGKYIDPEFWRLQLDTAYKYADGVIIWGGWSDTMKRREDWVDGKGWWLETQKFINNIKNKYE